MAIAKNARLLTAAALPLICLAFAACGGSSSTTTASTSAAGAVATTGASKGATTSTVGGTPLPADGCALLTAAEVTSFLGSTPNCVPVHRTTDAALVVGATWQNTPRDPDVSVSISHTTDTTTHSPTQDDKAAFEENSGTKSNAAAKVTTGLGDDAVIISPYPHTDNSGRLYILHGYNVISLIVDNGVVQGDALAPSLITVGRRLLASYG